MIHWGLCILSAQDEEELQEALADDYVRAEFLRDRLIPKAVLYFTGEAVEDDEEEEVRRDVRLACFASCSSKIWITCTFKNQSGSYHGKNLGIGFPSKI